MLVPLLAALSGCVGVYGTGQAAPPGQGSAGAPVRVGGGAPPTTLVSAQLQPPGPVDRDYILPVRVVVHLLFSRPIDPLTVTPQQFVLALADGRRVAPVGAFLAPGTGPGEQRSVALLIAAPAAASDKASPAAPAEPFSVTVTGLLHDADGRVLEGLASDIRPASAPVFAVTAEPGPAAVCAGRGQALRVFWSAPVRRPSQPAPAPMLLRVDGTRGPADLLVDGESPARPVLELCAPGLAAVRGIELASGVVIDERGTPAAAASLTLSPAP